MCLVVPDAGAEQHGVNESTICVIQDVFAVLHIMNVEFIREVCLFSPLF